MLTIRVIGLGNMGGSIAANFAGAGYRGLGFDLAGAAGNGQTAKVRNHLVLGSSMIAASEAFVLGAALGLSAQALFDVTSSSSTQCWAINQYCPLASLVPSSPANMMMCRALPRGSC